MWYYNINDLGDPFTERQKQYNAEQFEMEMTAKGWSLQAICGALGNISIESFVNPGQCEIGWGVPTDPPDVYYTGGLGLIGWTAYLRDDNPGAYPNALLLYAQQLGANWWDGLLQCNLIDAADDNPVHDYFSWIPDGPWTSVTSMAQYKTWSGSVRDAAACFCWNLEKPGDIYSTIPDRQDWADYWYNYFTHTPTPVPMSDLVKKIILFFMLLNRRKGKWWRW